MLIDPAAHLIYMCSRAVVYYIAKHYPGSLLLLLSLPITPMLIYSDVLAHILKALFRFLIIFFLLYFIHFRVRSILFNYLCSEINTSVQEFTKSHRSMSHEIGKKVEAHVSNLDHYQSEKT